MAQNGEIKNRNKSIGGDSTVYNPGGRQSVSWGEVYIKSFNMSQVRFVPVSLTTQWETCCTVRSCLCPWHSLYTESSCLLCVMYMFLDGLEQAGSQWFPIAPGSGRSRERVCRIPPCLSFLVGLCLHSSRSLLATRTECRPSREHRAGGLLSVGPTTSSSWCRHTGSVTSAALPSVPGGDVQFGPVNQRTLNNR